MALYGYKFKDIYKSLMAQYKKKNGQEPTQQLISAETGISEPDISKLKNGSRQLQEYDIEPLAKFFGVTEYEVITGISPKNANIHEAIGLNENSIEWLIDNKTNHPEYIQVLDLILNIPEVSSVLFRTFYTYMRIACNQLNDKEENNNVTNLLEAIGSPDTMIKAVMTENILLVLETLANEFCAQKLYTNEKFLISMSKSLKVARRALEERNTQFDIEELVDDISAAREVLSEKTKSESPGTKS